MDVKITWVLGFRNVKSVSRYPQTIIMISVKQEQKIEFSLHLNRLESTFSQINRRIATKAENVLSCLNQLFSSCDWSESSYTKTGTVMKISKICSSYFYWWFSFRSTIRGQNWWPQVTQFSSRPTQNGLLTTIASSTSHISSLCTHVRVACNVPHFVYSNLVQLPCPLSALLEVDPIQVKNCPWCWPLCRFSQTVFWYFASNIVFKKPQNFLTFFITGW